MNFFGLFYIADWLLLMLFVGFAIYEYFSWRFNELKELGIPGPKPSVPLGNLAELFQLGQLYADSEYVRRYGKIFGTYFGRQPIITVADLDIIRQVLIKDFDSFMDRRDLTLRGSLTKGLVDTNGERWRSLRRKLTPAFTSGKLKLMLHFTEKCAEAMVNNLDDFAKSGKMFEAKGMTDCFTSDNIASTSFGLEIDTQKTPDHPFVVLSKKIFNMSMMNILVLIAFFMPELAKLVEKIQPSCLPQDAEKYFVDLMNKAIEERKNNPTDKKDLIGIILDCEKDLLNMDEETKAVFEQGLGFSDTDKSGLSQEEVMANLFIFLLAGHDTTSGTLAYLLYNLAVHPDTQEKVFEEVETVVGNKDLEYSMLTELTYTEKCLNETMRLYPLSAKTDRKCVQERQYGSLRIPKGMLIGIPIAHFHYDPEIWPEPEKFNPNRFDVEEKAKRDPLSFMPFGQGPRMCIGNRFAIIAIKVALVYIVKNFRLLKCEKTEVPLTLRKDSIHLQALHGLWLKVEKR